MSNHIKMTVLDPENVYLMTFDRPDSGANIFDVETLTELDDRLKGISGDTGSRGVIFVSAKKSIFIAGADINELAEVKSGKELLEIVKLGQHVMNRIAELQAVTVAAIHGAALGGGFELCLACDYRLASNERVTQIGLPETSLGILPCWGGATRLPRLIGLPKALDIVLNGRKLAPIPALKAGMVDELIPREHLQRFALEYVLKGKPHRPTHALTNSGVGASLIAKRVLAQVLKKTHGHYPAVTKSLEVIAKGVAGSVEASLQLEREAIVELSATSACRNLIGIFRLQDRAKKLGKTKEPMVQRAAVIGAGVMGSGIAQWISARGLGVILRDVNEEQVRRGLANAAKLYSDAAKKHVLDKTAARRGLERIAPAATEVPLKNVDFVIEAAVEEMAAKMKIFARLSEICGASTILATNTSALSISTLAEATRAPDRVIGMHFFNPVHRMQLVEIVAGEKTSAETVERTVRFAQQIGKLPVVVRDGPGFIVNRILMPYLVEAGLLFEQGASIEELDACMLEFGMPMGPMRLLDEVGIDVALHVATELSSAFIGRLTVPPLLASMVKAGLLGRKVGRGFYTYRDMGEPAVNPAVRELSAAPTETRLHPDELERRMVLLMINESAQCVEDKIAAEPADVDFAMIMGTGFAPFRGGPLRYADSQGISQIQEDLSRHARQDIRFKPAKLLSNMAVENKTFYGER